MNAHTPGEWHVTGKRDINGKHLHIGCKGSMMALASLNAVHIDTEANARLIAAAPDLLAELSALLAMCERQDDFNDDGDGGMFERARAAIAKAKGETA